MGWNLTRTCCFRTGNIPFQKLQIQEQITIAIFDFRCVTRKEIYEELDKLPLNKSPGPMGIQAFCLQQGKLATGTHLQFAINERIIHNQFPSFLKKVYITLAFKKRKKQVASNYRPIFVTNTLSKIFERLLLNQFMEYLKQNSLLNLNQFGFQGKKIYD